MSETIISATGTQHGLLVNSDGSINVSGVSVTLTSGDIEIGAVELKDQLSDNRVTVAGSRLWTEVLGSVVVTGVPNPLYVTPSGTFFVSGNVVNTGSVTVTNQSSSYFVPSGNFFVVSGNAWTGIGSVFGTSVSPTHATQNNPLFNLTFSGGVLTRAVQFIGTGSYVKDLSYSGTTLAQAGSWY